MAFTVSEMEEALATLLKPTDYRDYCPNGLQIEGRPEITKIVSGVTASQAFIEAAIEQQADAILVHHGYFWTGEDPSIKGIKKNRIKRLLENDINLFAYHLPLDAHATLGNNAQLGLKLGFEVEGQMDPRHKSKVGVYGSLKNACSSEELSLKIENELGRAPFVIEGKSKIIKTIAWCTGSAQNSIELAHANGVDAYLTGEVSEQTVHFARETGIHFFAAGHHATERYGVQAVGNFLAQKFSLQHEFIDIDNPV
jgi:dinuclear metal center YbgI/SA1388 family protein